MPTPHLHIPLLTLQFTRPLTLRPHTRSHTHANTYEHTGYCPRRRLRHPLSPTALHHPHPCLHRPKHQHQCHHRHQHHHPRQHLRRRLPHLHSLPLPTPRTTPTPPPALPRIGTQGWANRRTAAQLFMSMMPSWRVGRHRALSQIRGGPEAAHVKMAEPFAQAALVRRRA